MHHFLNGIEEVIVGFVAVASLVVGFLAGTARTNRRIARHIDIGPIEDVDRHVLAVDDHVVAIGNLEQSIKARRTNERVHQQIDVALLIGGRVVATATVEGMTRAINAGVSTIEHGDDGNEEVFKLMKERGVALCPTLAAGDAISQYRGWKKGIDAEPARITNKKKTFAMALRTGVTICMGGDVGVYKHGDNAKEMELMVEYGMKPIDVLKSATSINADVFGYSDKIGRVKNGLLADLIAVQSDPSVDIRNIRNIKLVIKDGIVYKQ